MGYAESTLAEEKATAVINQYLNNWGDNVKLIQMEGGEADMSDFNLEVGGDFSGVAGHGNIVIESFKKIEQSSAHTDLKASLKELTSTVGDLIQKLPPAEADAAARDLKNFTDEALSPKPRPSILEALGDGLKKTAEVVGEVGAPVASIVATIIGLL